MSDIRNLPEKAWEEYKDLDPIKRLKNEGRELIGEIICFSEKRDGECTSLWLDENKEVKISSHHQKEASSDIVNRMKATPQYEKVKTLLLDEKENYNNNYICFGELLKTISPTRIEPNKKHVSWVLFDIYDLDVGRYLEYNHIYQKAYHFKIPIVRVVMHTCPKSLEELFSARDACLKWCRKHRREGVVGKSYATQVFFKEKIDLPKDLQKIERPNKLELPTMDEHTILRSLQHAYDEIGEENWKNKVVAMPIVAKHFNVECHEHSFSMPRNIYQLYVETPIEKIRGIKE